jgi:hypothetical protein
MSTFIDALVAVSAVTALFTVWRLEKKHDALAKHVFDLEDRLSHLLKDIDDDDE